VGIHPAANVKTAVNFLAALIKAVPNAHGIESEVIGSRMVAIR
jgi:hypothetical protein